MNSKNALIECLISCGMKKHLTFVQQLIKHYIIFIKINKTWCACNYPLEIKNVDYTRKSVNRKMDIKFQRCFTEQQIKPSGCRYHGKPLALRIISNNRWLDRPFAARRVKVTIQTVKPVLYCCENKGFTMVSVAGWFDVMFRKTSLEFGVHCMMG